MKSNTEKLFLKDKELYYFIFGMPLLLFFLITYIYIGNINKGIAWIRLHPREAIANYLIAFSIINVWLIFARTKIYLLLTSLIGFLLITIVCISRIKSNLRGEPFSILDFRLAEEAINISKVLDRSYFLPFVVIALTMVLSMLIITFHVKGKMTTKYQYGIALGCASFLIFGYTMNVNAFGKINIAVPADVSWNHDRNGFLLATLIDSKFLQVPAPKEYRKETVEKIYNKISKNNSTLENTSKVKPNVIFVLSESFWDPGFCEKLKLNLDPIPNFHQLAKESSSGIIHVPGIGGGTANSEYEVLTGLTKHFIRNYSVPYNPYNDYIYRPIRSLATIFSEQNYESTAIHTYHSWFYRRNEVYKKFGFDKFISLETLKNEPKIKGLFTEDQTITDLIMNQLNQSSKKDFILAVTMQGHGPYQDMVVPANKIKVQNTMSSNAKQLTEKYLNNLFTIDEELGNLINRLKQMHEPTLLVFFGDHIPPLGDEVYKEIGFKTIAEKAKETPALIWSNYKKFTETFHFQANMLGAYALNKAGIQSDLFMNYLYKYSQSSPQISDTLQPDFFHDFEILQYDIMHGKQYFYDFIGKPKEKNEFKLGEPSVLRQVIAKETADAYTIEAIGEGIGWMSKLTINGKEYDTKISNGKIATATVPKAEMASGKLTFVIKTKDSRGKVIKETNEIEYNDVQELKKNTS